MVKPAEPKIHHASGSLRGSRHARIFVLFLSFLNYHHYSHGNVSDVLRRLSPNSPNFFCPRRNRFSPPVFVNHRQLSHRLLYRLHLFLAALPSREWRSNTHFYGYCYILNVRNIINFVKEDGGGVVNRPFVRIFSP